ncbi:MAG: hypothetical protein H6600_02250 [Flavobacteriales bacterium]|nr:hypothetical protein [Flavobacteriales bacterium]
MAKRLFIFLFSITVTFNFIGQSNESKDFSLAKVGFQTQGVYVFILCEPYFEYDFIETINVSIDWNGDFEKSMEKTIEKARKKHTNFNGIIFRSRDMSKAELIKFSDKEITEYGYAVGDYVSFIRSDVYYVGRVVKLGTDKDGISVEHYNNQGGKEITKLNPKNLSAITEDEYKKILQKAGIKLEN